MPKIDIKSLVPFIGVLLFAAAVYVVTREMHDYNLREIRRAVFGLPPGLLAACVFFTALGYVALSLYDWLGLEYAGEKLSYRRVLLASFISYALSNNIGQAPLSGGSMRYRLYSDWGISAGAVAKVVLFCTVTYFVGALTLMVGGYFLTAAPPALPGGAPPEALFGAVLLSGAALAAWGGLIVFRRRPVILRGFVLPVPGISLALRQALVALADISLAGMVLYLPLQKYTDMTPQTFLVYYVLAQIGGLLSQAPGGIGVFEASFLLLTRRAFDSSHVAAALVVYRIIYYFLPLAFAGAALAAYEARRHGEALSKSVFLRVAKAVLPRFFSAALLIGGAILLFSGATPALESRLEWLRYVVPLPVIEFSHLLGSVAGVLLLFLSLAVRRRLDSAYWATLGVLALGVATSLAKGGDYEEAAILGVMMALLAPCRGLFYRKSALLSLDLDPTWLALSSLILAIAVGLGFLSYKHVNYSQELWWQFSLHGDASRFLRSLVAIAVVAGAILLYRLLTLGSRPSDPALSTALSKTAPIVLAARETMPHLALTGDKDLLWSDSGKSFIMFDTTPGYWIAMGDPVGDHAEFEALAWKFRELADRYCAKAAFYQVGVERLPLYLDLGMTLFKLGEEARVPLPSFGLEGGKRTSLRHAYNKLGREGLVFEVVPAAEVPPLLPELKEISDRWLTDKRAQEKGFSLGYFDEAYLKRCDIAVIRREGRVLAFANLWTLDTKEELSVDLMRYLPEAPNGLMEYLTVSLMLWGKAQGYRWFNLGMAPLSGFETHPLAPLWHKIGKTIFRFGNEFYNFEGLYNYKNKFTPVWMPRYFATPPRLSAPSALLAVTGIISRKAKGVLKA